MPRVFCCLHHKKTDPKYLSNCALESCADPKQEHYLERFYTSAVVTVKLFTEINLSM